MPTNITVYIIAEMHNSMTTTLWAMLFPKKIVVMWNFSSRIYLQATVVITDYYTIHGTSVNAKHIIILYHGRDQWGFAFSCQKYQPITNPHLSSVTILISFNQSQTCSQHHQIQVTN